METTKQEKMKRGEFLRSLGLSTSTLMAFYCLGTTMTACGSKDEDPEPTPNPNPGGGTGITGTTTGSNVNFTIDLANATIVSTLVSGVKYIVTGDVLVALTTSGAYVALSKKCTHEGTAVQYRSAQNDIFCPNHGSEFSVTGAVEQGPAATALQAFKTALSADGKTLTVTA